MPSVAGLPSRHTPPQTMGSAEGRHSDVSHHALRSQSESAMQGEGTEGRGTQTPGGGATGSPQPSDPGSHAGRHAGSAHI